ncbi:hypothetical protein POPTR_010G212850v4 [Populus trichocarpa]|uniref:Uncharacterized protein n=1 Tax=Populus trichocarpa TaxID=3694 RepID=A0ACC0SEQ6_POPTR|nr:hypothetical protein POPTR_010G212850v4 [Populus trichocarpa]
MAIRIMKRKDAHISIHYTRRFSSKKQRERQTQESSKSSKTRKGRETDELLINYTMRVHNKTWAAFEFEFG